MIRIDVQTTITRLGVAVRLRADFDPTLAIRKGTERIIWCPAFGARQYACEPMVEPVDPADAARLDDGLTDAEWATAKALVQAEGERAFVAWLENQADERDQARTHDALNRWIEEG